MDNQNDTLHLNTDAVKVEISKDEAIHRIKNIYHSQYDPNSTMDAWDQLLACETIGETTPISDTYFDEKSKSNERVSVNGNVNDTYKQTVDFKLTESQHKVITRLEAYTYRTTPIKVAELLEEFFCEWPSMPGYWLSVARKWPPRRICGVIWQIIKQQRTGWTTVQNPAKLFSFLIKKRVKRKCRFMGTNDSCRQQSGT